MEHLEALLQPIGAESPCGEFARYTPEFDRLNAARQQDDETLPTGVWQTAPQRADWEEVENIASEMTRTKSKDLVIFGWLGEAGIKLRGLRALPDALGLIVLALERFPEELHPQIKEGDYEYRAAPLSWIAQHYAVLVADAPLLLTQEAQLSLTEWQQGKHPASGLDEHQGLLLLQALTESLQWIQRLNAVCETWPETTAPSFAALEQKIKLCQQALNQILPVAAVVAEMPELSPCAVPATFARREDAYLMIKQVADYLAKTEPHSPVPYLLQRAWSWGHTPLPELLSELISSDDAARRLWRQLGVLP